LIEIQKKGFQMRTSVVGAVALVAVLVVGTVVVGLRNKGPVQSSDVAGVTSVSSPTPQLAAAQPDRIENDDAQLSDRLKSLCGGASGDFGVAVIHIETGRTALIEGAKQLPLYSVFKLPLAVAVLKDVEAKKLLLDRKVRVTPEDVAPGSQFNTDLWRKPIEKTVAELLELSIVRSDNTSSDKLLQLVGGPAAVTQQMCSLGFPNINIQYTVREFAARRDRPNTGTASDLAHLLAQLQKGEVLQPPQLTLLLGFMTRAMTGGERRLRADLPPGTPVADKTGTGEPGTSTNDVGLITLPEERGHLAIAVLLSGSKSSVEAQEKLIAQLARAAYDSYVSLPAPRTE
jgi:beta-lactamase class A